LKKINTLKDKQWEDIVQTAWDSYEGSRYRSGPGLDEDADDDDVVEQTDDDDELIDPMYDNIE
jgi:hypothetical protein